MNLYLKTLKSLTRREKTVGIFFLAVFLISFYKVILFHFFAFEALDSENSYTEGLVGEITHLNPVFTEFSDADADISSLIFSGLVQYNPQTKSFDEDIATHTLSDDKLTYTFTLKNGIFWHDGTEVTADDLYYTFAEVIQSPDFKNPILKSNFESVKVEKVDSRTITFTLNSANSFFFSSLTVGILPKHLLSEIPVAELDTAEFNQLPVGTGPYKVEQAYQINSDGSTHVDLVLNPDYYADIPSIERLRFIAYPTSDLLLENRSVWNGAARLRPNLLEGEDLEKLVLYTYELPQYTALFFNTDSAKLSRNKARLGISKALDKVDLLETLGDSKQIDTPLLELTQDDWIHVHDQNEAMGALADAGWTWTEGEKFRSNTDGETFTLRLIRRDFSQDNPAQEEIAQVTADVIQNQLEEVGVDVQIEAYPVDELTGIITERNFDMLLYGQSLGYNLDIFSYWHSSQAGETGLNLSNYQNPKADFLLESIRSTFDLEERQELLEALAQIIAEDVPAVFLYSPTYNYVVDSRITGIQTENLLIPHDRFANISSWVLH